MATAKHDIAAQDTTPLWTAATFPEFPALAEDVSADVAVVGGGITGLTAAYLLARAGKRVVVLERDRCAGAETAHTSAHLTMVTDTRLTELVQQFGASHAQAVWDAGLAAMATIDDAVRGHAIEADFEWLDGYLHAPVEARSDDERDRLRADAALATELGFDAEYVDEAPLVAMPAIRFSNQARIQPRKYLSGLAKAVTALGGRIYEASAAAEVLDDPMHVKANGHAVACADVVLATHVPLAGVTDMLSAAAFQTKLSLYSSYVIAARVAKGRVPDALWWDTANPYEFLRIEPHPRFDLLIVGGQDHKTGQVDDTAGCYQRLEARVAALVPGAEVTHRWSGQVIETPDGLPYIGRTADHQYAATGYAGNGLTFGTLAAMMITDAILGRSNPWTDLFEPGRRALTHGLWDYLKQNLDYPYYLIRDRFAGAQTRSLRSLKRGQGAILDRDGARVAAYRDLAGRVTLRSAVCTHLGCTVAWNTAERTWDCPCHGSRFTPTGDVVSGPAETPLSRAE